MMPSLLFITIGMAAGAYGLANMIPAGRDQKKAGKVNARAEELLKSIAADGEMQGIFFQLEPMMPVMKKKIVSGVKAGILAVLGAYGMAGAFAAIGRLFFMPRSGAAGKFTILSVLGDGSPAVKMAVLAGIAVGMTGAVLGVHVRKNASANLGKAYANLFRAKRAKREKVFKMTEAVMQEK